MPWLLITRTPLLLPPRCTIAAAVVVICRIICGLQELSTTERIRADDDRSAARPALRHEQSIARQQPSARAVPCLWRPQRLWFRPKLPTRGTRSQPIAFVVRLPLARCWALTQNHRRRLTKRGRTTSWSPYSRRSTRRTSAWSTSARSDDRCARSGIKLIAPQPTSVYLVGERRLQWLWK